ncbi:MAG: hypothetical protein GXP40_09595 [Chloroflexi bacterium]|nr:hypothetical protein [Chloroflexota bacterium]
MTKKYFFLITIILLGISSCSPAAETATATALPPPIATIIHPTEAPATDTPQTTPATATNKECKDRALFIEDVTVPDNTKFEPGESFVKTWRLRNIGGCTWGPGYTLVFVRGDQMNSPASIPLSETAPRDTLDISVDLVAPSTDGVFTGYYELHNPAGETIPVGELDHVWLKIIVGTGAPIRTAQPATASGPCSYQENAAYVDEVLSLINAARADNSLPALTVNPQLAAAAQGHSMDMACNSLLSHTGSDGSSVASRIAAQGYSASYFVENIYAGGGPQDAMTWWMDDLPHREAILNTQITEIGIGYAYVGSSTYGGYFAVDFASP